MWLIWGWVSVLEQVRSLTCERWYSANWFGGDKTPRLAVLQENALVVLECKKSCVFGSSNLLVLKYCFSVNNLKLDTIRWDVSFWYFRNFYKSINSLSLIGFGPLPWKDSHLTLLFNLVSSLTSNLPHFLISMSFFLFLSLRVDHLQKRERLFSCPCCLSQF